MARATRVSSIALLVLALAVAGTWAQSFKKVMVLTSSTYKQVAESKPAVIYAVAEEDSFEGGAALAKELEGQARVCVVNIKTSDELKKEVAKIDKDAKFMAKPFGEDAEITVYETLEEAKKAAIESLPTDLVTEIKDFNEIQRFLMTTTQQSKLPMLLFSDKDGVPPLMTKLSYWLNDHLEIAVIPKPPPELKQQLGVKDLPSLVIMVPQEVEDGSGQVGFNGAQYNKDQFGALKFKNVLKFSSLVIQEMSQKGFFKAREEAKANKPAKAAKMVPLYEYTSDTADACATGKLGLCILTFIDGSPLNQEKEAQLQVIRDVQEAPSMKGRVLTFVWIDQTCHSSVAEYFNVDYGTLPAVVAVSPKKAAYAQHVGSFDMSKISGFIGGVLGGQVKIGKLPGDGTVPVPSADDDCESAHKSMMPIEEDPLDDEMADILAEMRAEEEAAAKEKEAEVVEEDSADLEEKIRKAQAEADRMNKWSNKKRKKGGKKKKKKKKKTKTEL